MEEKISNNSRSLKWEQSGELAHKDLSELIERLNLLLRSCFYKNLSQIIDTELKINAKKIPRVGKLTSRG